jgi:hypothetical protein
VELTALPREGYRFVEWHIASVDDGESTIHYDPLVSVDVATATRAEAIFAPLPAPFIKLTAGSSTVWDSSEWFPGEGTAPELSAMSGDSSVLLASMVDGELVLTAIAAGETTVLLTQVSDGVQDFEHALRVLVYAEPFDLSQGNYVFDNWPVDEMAGSYPPHILFTQSDTSDPDLVTPLLFAYRIPPEDAREPVDVTFPYAASQRTRINGLGEKGISFINTGRGRDLGAAVLSLDTTGASNIRVLWTAGTEIPNSRIYGLRLQYRIGLGGPWLDVPDASGAPVGYVRNVVQGHQVRFDPVTLPEETENQALVQLRWKYHHISGTDGSRAALRLDDIVVAAGSPKNFSDWLLFEVPDPTLRSDPDYSGPFMDPSESGFPNLVRFALGLGINEDPTSRMPGVFVDEEGEIFYHFPYDPLLNDIDYRVLASEDLEEWHDVLFDSRFNTAPPSDDGWLGLPLDPASNRFIRLLVIPETN